jgi:polyisoprenoid-binding protein YceI
MPATKTQYENHGRLAWAAGAGAILLMLLSACGGGEGDLPLQLRPTRTPSPIVESPTPPPTVTPTVPPAATTAPSPRPASDSTPAPPSASTNTPPFPTPTWALPTATPTLAAPTPTLPAEPTVPIQLVLEIRQGTAARYLVKEQFIRRSLPNDAIGKTEAVSGSIVLDSDGVVQSDLSTITVQLRGLRSDEDDRDDFLMDRSLESIKFPLAEYAVEQTPGLPWPLPQDGEAAFQLEGSMTLHGVTSPLTWEVVASFSPDGATGQAKTSFKFDKFNIEKPSLFFLLSVEDNIRLELDFVVSLGPAR